MAAKPVKLDINRAGAWKNVLLFDAGNECDNQAILDAAAALGHAAKCRFRITRADALSTPLMYWSELEGWVLA